MVDKTTKEIRIQAIEMLKQSEQLSAEQIAKQVGSSAAKINRILLQTPDTYFNGLMFEYLKPNDPRRGALLIRDALSSSKWRPTLFGQHIMHSWAEIAFLEQILGHYKFSNTVELGTASGGLTTLLMLHGLRTHAKVLSIDIKNEPDTEPYNTLKTVSNYTFLKGNAIKPTPIHHKTITSTIKRVGRTLLYCDANGYRKARIHQMNHWVPYMKIGDVVAAHDYPTQITEAEVKPLIDKYNLKPFHQEEAWSLGCRVLIYERT